MYFVYNFYNFKYLINKRQQSAVIIRAIRTTKIKPIKLFFFRMKISNLSLKTFTLMHMLDSQKNSLYQKKHILAFTKIIFEPQQESFSISAIQKLSSTPGKNRCVRFLYFSLYKDYFRILARIDMLVFYIPAYTKIIFNPWQESMCYFFIFGLYKDYLQTLARINVLVFANFIFQLLRRLSSTPARGRCVNFCLVSILFFNKNLFQLKIRIMFKASDKAV